MAIEWLAGNRLRGTTAERPALGLPSGSVGGWKELARTTLGSAGDTIDVSSLADKRYYMVLSNLDNSGTVNNYTRLNSDSGSNYARRRSENGGTDSTAVSQTVMGYFGNGDSGDLQFGVSYFSNLSSKEKLMQQSAVAQSTAGAGNAPDRMEGVGKHAQTSNPISTITNVNLSTNLNSGSEVVVLGWDPSDTHTTNFWEELASVNASGSSTNLSSGTITAKKYLWVQLWTSDVAGDVNTTFNNDTGTNYARRYSTNGGTDSTTTSQSNLNNLLGAGNGTKTFSNTFIINNSANEKLSITNHIRQNTAGAGTAPTRMENVGKWSNTSAQITEIDIDSTSGNFSSTSILKVWGSD